MSENVIIIDYDMGNLFSVKRACEYVGIDAKISSNLEAIKNAEAIILPGVGAFGQAMANLSVLGIDKVIKEAVSNGIPLLGICLGMQLLFSESEEFGNQSGLGIIEGKIRKFPTESDGKKLRIPQIAWNQIMETKLFPWKDSFYKDLKNKEYMYFVHSFYADPIHKNNVFSITNYQGFNYCSSIIQGKNVFATQFHPEKSGEQGLTIYKNWGLRYGLIGSIKS